MEILIHPEGDTSVPPCAMMSESGCFDALDRQGPIDDSKQCIDDNLGKFILISEHERIKYPGLAHSSAGFS